jgi:hypothetical protein
MVVVGAAGIRWAGMAASPFPGGAWRGSGGGLDLAAEGERGDGAQVGGADGLGDHVPVLLGGDAQQVGDGGVRAQLGGGALEGEQFAELGRPADLTGGDLGGQGAGDFDGAAVDLQVGGEVVVDPLTGLPGDTPRLITSQLVVAGYTSFNSLKEVVWCPRWTWSVTWRRSGCRAGAVW